MSTVMDARHLLALRINAAVGAGSHTATDLADAVGEPWNSEGFLVALEALVRSGRLVCTSGRYAQPGGAG